jgi:hypothetical protein
VNLFVSLRLIQSMGSKRCATFVKERTVKPVWEEEFSLMVEEQDAELVRRPRSRPRPAPPLTARAPASQELVVYNLEHHGGHRFVGSAVVRPSATAAAARRARDAAQRSAAAGRGSPSSALTRGRGRRAQLRVSELEGGETTDEWYLLSLHPDLISGGGPEDPLLRVQLTLAAFRCSEPVTPDNVRRCPPHWSHSRGPPALTRVR